MLLSKDFFEEEFVKSATANTLHIPNEPTAEQRANLQRLVTKLLQPLRDLVARPLTINSGYRCLALNTAVGGQPSSQHTKGEAADVSGLDPKTLLGTLLKSGLVFDQAIVYPTFLHLSYREGKNRKQVLFKM
jgi:uncharacterized protein YcbK (DUF882 family)